LLVPKQSIYCYILLYKREYTKYITKTKEYIIFRYYSYSYGVLFCFFLWFNIYYISFVSINHYHKECWSPSFISIALIKFLSVTYIHTLIMERLQGPINSCVCLSFSYFFISSYYYFFFMILFVESRKVLHLLFN
jgi:hypothetical protein